MTIEVLSNLYQNSALSKKLCSRARSMLRDDSLAQDAVQQTFVKLLSMLKHPCATPMTQKELVGVLFRTLRNCSIDMLRARRTRAALAVDALDKHPDRTFAHSIDECMVTTKLCNAWGRLSMADQRLLLDDGQSSSAGHVTSSPAEHRRRYIARKQLRRLIQLEDLIPLSHPARACWARTALLAPSGEPDLPEGDAAARQRLQACTCLLIYAWMQRCDNISRIVALSKVIRPFRWIRGLLNIRCQDLLRFVPIAEALHRQTTRPAPTHFFQIDQSNSGEKLIGHPF